MRTLEWMANGTAHFRRRIAAVVLAMTLDTGVSRLRQVEKVRRSVRVAVEQLDHFHRAIGRKPAAAFAPFRAEGIAARGLAPLVYRNVA